MDDFWEYTENANFWVSGKHLAEHPLPGGCQQASIMTRLVSLSPDGAGPLETVVTVPVMAALRRLRSTGFLSAALSWFYHSDCSSS